MSASSLASALHIVFTNFPSLTFPPQVSAPTQYIHSSWPERPRSYYWSFSHLNHMASHWGLSLALRRQNIFKKHSLITKQNNGIQSLWNPKFYVPSTVCYTLFNLVSMSCAVSVWNQWGEQGVVRPIGLPQASHDPALVSLFSSPLTQPHAAGWPEMSTYLSLAGQASHVHLQLPAHHPDWFMLESPRQSLFAELPFCRSSSLGTSHADITRRPLFWATGIPTHGHKEHPHLKAQPSPSLFLLQS